MGENRAQYVRNSREMPGGEPNGGMRRAGERNGEVRLIQGSGPQGKVSRPAEDRSIRQARSAQQPRGDQQARSAQQARGDQQARSAQQPRGDQQARSPRQAFGARAQAEKAQLMRQIQQLSLQQIQMRKRVALLAFLVALLLLVNILAAVGMYFRIQHINKALMLTQSRAAGSPEAGTDGQGRMGQGASSGASVGQDALASEEQSRGQDYVSLCGLDKVDRPRERTYEEVLERLEELAAEEKRIAAILENRFQYPDKLLEALANNPEMTDFVAGYPDRGSDKEVSLTREEKEQEFPLFLQWDPRWGYEEYGDGSNIGLAGCGPTCLSMALYYLTGDESLTPDRMAAYSMENGYYISGTGTAWALLQDVPERYGVAVSQPKAAEDSMKAALDGGSVIICSMGPGDFTAAGHFIIIYGYDRKGFLVNDPNCVARSRQSWGFDELKGQIKNIWVLGGSAKTGSVPYREVTTVTD